MKKIFLVLTTLVTVLNINSLVFAKSTPIITEKAEITTQLVITPYAEETEWKFRIYKNKLQQRLWSITYGHWIGQWQNVD
jgi:hypothetical protein